MSDTIVDMAKVTQMLDSGWVVTIDKCGGSYRCVGWHPNKRVRDQTEEKLRMSFVASDELPEYDPEWDWTDDDRLITDDFTPEQALTRLAYKVHGKTL